MGLREDEIDHICTECGKVVSGPHTGETMKQGERQQLGTTGYFRGSPISDMTCDDCQKKAGGYEEDMARAHGPDWREKAAQRKRELDAQKLKQEQPKKPHIWWRKIGE